ncbi:MAG TPA: vitamin K epoxide reductase family protein [Pyrinomonadaceae bacterium]|nr:vitamin K epoxide reductase family protein [Pyrinomonadaceae bacterium]
MLYAIAALLALLGLADAVYLTINHLTGQTARCTVTGGCNEVLGSAYATAGGVPIAALGAVAYFAVFSLATLVLFGYRWARTILALLVGLMLLTTLWLLFVQAFILHKFCDYCLLSATIILILSGIVVIASRRERAAE